MARKQDGFYVVQEIAGDHVVLEDWADTTQEAFDLALEVMRNTDSRFRVGYSNKVRILTRDSELVWEGKL